MGVKRFETPAAPAPYAGSDSWLGKTSQTVVNTPPAVQHHSNVLPFLAGAAVGALAAEAFSKPEVVVVDSDPYIDDPQRGRIRQSEYNAIQARYAERDRQLEECRAEERRQAEERRKEREIQYDEYILSLHGLKNPYDDPSATMESLAHSQYVIDRHRAHENLAAHCENTFQKTKYTHDGKTWFTSIKNINAVIDVNPFVVFRGGVLSSEDRAAQIKELNALVEGHRSRIRANGDDKMHRELEAIYDAEEDARAARKLMEETEQRAVEERRAAYLAAEFPEYTGSSSFGAWVHERKAQKKIQEMNDAWLRGQDYYAQQKEAIATERMCRKAISGILWGLAIITMVLGFASMVPVLMLVGLIILAMAKGASILFRHVGDENRLASW